MTIKFINNDVMLVNYEYEDITNGIILTREEIKHLVKHVEDVVHVRNKLTNQFQNAALIVEDFDACICAEGFEYEPMEINVKMFTSKELDAFLDALPTFARWL